MPMSFLYRAFVMTGASFLVFYIAPGIAAASLYTAFMLASIMGLINASVPYIVSMATLRRTLLNVGLFMIAVNTFALYLMHRLGLGFYARNFTALLLAAVTIAAISWFATLALSRGLNIK